MNCSRRDFKVHGAVAIHHGKDEWHPHQLAKHAGHSAAIRCVVHNPKQAAFVTCSEDATVRAWVAQ